MATAERASTSDDDTDTGPTSYDSGTFAGILRYILEAQDCIEIASYFSLPDDVVNAVQESHIYMKELEEAEEQQFIIREVLPLPATLRRDRDLGDSAKCMNCRTSSLQEFKCEDERVVLECQNEECLSIWKVTPTSFFRERATINNYQTFFCKPPRRLDLSIKMEYQVVQDITELKPGDHIIFERYGLYDQHAILVSTTNSATLDVIYSTLGCPLQKSLFTCKSEAPPSMKNEKISFPSSGVRRVVYDWQDQRELVLARAFSLLQRSEKGYNLFCDNCEHFATYCKTGVSYSVQGHSLKKFRPRFQQVLTLRSYSHLKEKLVSRLGRDDCEKLAMSPAISAGEELDAVLNSGRPASTPLLALEEREVIQPSNVDRLEETSHGCKMSPSLYDNILKVKQRMDIRLPHWTSFVVFLIAFGLVTIPLPSDAEHCPKRQAAELGKAGLINCSLPEDFYDVYWFDNISESSPFVIRFQPNEEGVKSGPGFESGDYDVLEDGSLKIANVTAWHERKYRVIISKQSSQTPENLLISLNVTATPSDHLPAVPCQNCHQDYYYTAMEGEILSCAFNATKPPVQLEWFEQRGDGYERVEMQQLNKTENSNGTFNSLATIHLPKDSTGFIHLLVCRAAWSLSDWRREREILLDFSSSFSDVTSKVQYMEVNKYSKIQCGQPASVYVIWKRLLSDNNPETIGFSSHSMTETISNTQDVEISAEGSLVFASPGVDHEGMYTCIYGDGLNEEIQMTSVKLLIPPSPPYIQNTGCDDESYGCVIREDSTKKLSCAVYGARPNVTLEWIAEDEDEVSFFNHTPVFKERGETYDTILSVEYKVSQDVLCGKEILIKCHLYGPLSNIMKAESTVSVIPASCRQNEVKEEHGLNGVVIALAVLYSLIVIVIAFWIVYRKRQMYNAVSKTETAERHISNEARF